MNFISWSFVALFIPVFLARLAFGRRKNETLFVWFTIVASTVFVMWHVPIYVFIMLTTISVDYFAARWIDQSPGGSRRRKVFLFFSMAANLMILGFFKYANFFLRVLDQFLHVVGYHASLPQLDLILPMGISFYTFGSMSYTIDVYRGRLKAIKRYRDFYYFVTFFPHLVAGPIIRAEQFFYQFPRVRRLWLPVFNHAGYMIIRGAFLKMVCADNIAPVVNNYWIAACSRGAGAHQSFANLLLLALLFGTQIFCDFEGYSSIARGLAYLMGYRFPINFRNPYIATSFSNFWERWHITLSSWLRDYLYFPLGGNRISPWRTYVNLLVVMLLGGLWHGAALTFIAWGAFHGLALATERLLGMNRNDGSKFVGLLWYFVVQAGVFFGWILFRSASLGAAVHFVHNLVDLKAGHPNRNILFASMYMLPLIGMHLHGLLVERGLSRPINRLETAALAGFMLFAIMAIHGKSSEFIYFQF
jgi:alginate O-acetyltransferase complex protein AlgI